MMEQILEQMLLRYEIKTIDDKANAIKEIVQEVVLCGLSRGGFFNEAAFYGGTALRIFYGLDRFSEDLDFSLLSVNPNFDLEKYFPYIEKETKALGLNFSVVEKEKTKESNIKSAFLKGNTKEHILSFYNDSTDLKFINPQELIKVKFEVDINPPVGATFENKFGLLPSPYQVRLYDLPSLFAGKIHACLCRNWKSRVKGRDFYDFVFFITKGAKVNLQNLKAKLIQSNFIKEGFELTIDEVKKMLKQRFESLDFKQAKEDVLPFVKDKTKLDLWGKEFFINLVERLEEQL